MAYRNILSYLLDSVIELLDQHPRHIICVMVNLSCLYWVYFILIEDLLWRSLLLPNFSFNQVLISRFLISQDLANDHQSQILVIYSSQLPDP